MKSLAHHVQQRPIAGDIGEELRWMKAARHVAQLAQRYGRRELCRFAQPQCKGFWQTRKILKELVALEPGYSAESPPQEYWERVCAGLSPWRIRRCYPPASLHRSRPSLTYSVAHLIAEARYSL